MAQIANLTGHTDTATNYSTIAHDYLSQWLTLGFALDTDPPHAKLSYGSVESDTNATWGLLYNLFADRELGLQLVPQSVYDTQDAFYKTVFDQYGVPLDTRHGYTKSKSTTCAALEIGDCQLMTLVRTDDWELFIAAVSSPALKERFISTIATWLGSTSTNFAFTDLYDAVTGE